MAVSTIQVTLPCDAQKVWSVVTSLTDYAWRSDLGKIEIRSDTQFIEYTPQGYPTAFTVTASEPCSRWEFDMENSRMRGHWTGLFTEKDGQTTLDFTETVTPKNPLLRPLLGGYLKKQQRLYMEDLKKALL